MRNAPATFQRLINKVLSGLECCTGYFDDVIVYSSNWEEHVTQIAALFDRLSAANLTINLAKCELGKATVTYLGKIVGMGQVRLIEVKIEPINNFPVPVNRRELHCFLGTVGYYRGFCKNFSTIAFPLTNLLSPRLPFYLVPGVSTGS